MINPLAAHVRKYAALPEEVLELRRMVRLWVAEDSFWDFDSVLETLSKPSASLRYLTLDDSEHWAAAIIYQAVMEHSDLIYLYVLPQQRGKGYAKVLMQDMIDQVKKLPQMQKLFLEVKDTNSAAIKLYQTFNMVELRRVKGYYKTGEEAVVFALDLSHG